jgi:hypothetical protein
MQSMRVSELLVALEEFRSKLIEHRQLWGQSLDSPMPSFPVRNVRELEAQSEWLTRRLGALRPYIERFDSTWIMNHPATGTVWDALDAATGLMAVSQIKGPSLGNVVQKLNTIAGRLESLDPNDTVPADRVAPLRTGLGPDRLMLSYLEHLHPYIAKGCSKLFIDEHYAQAVEESAKAVFQYLRDASGLSRHANTTQRHKPSRETLAAFAYGQISAQKRPQPGLRAEAACVETPAGWVGPRGEGRPAEVLALGYEIGRFSRDLCWPSAGVSALVACCGRPQSASREAGPWSSEVPAYRSLSM